MKDLRKMSDGELTEWISGWKSSTKEHILGMAELDRRKNRGNTVRGWIAVGISVVALLVSIIALFYKRAS